MTKTRKRPMGVLMVIENNGFPDDVRVRAEAAALAAAGYRVSVVCPRRAGQPLHSREGAIEVFRYPAPPEASRFAGYIWEYAYSIFASLVVSVLVLARSGFTVIHAANPPDLLFLLGLFYRPFRKRFVFDHHDLSPELFSARFGPRGHALVRRVLLWAERQSFRTADLVVSTNESYRNVALGRGRVDPSRSIVVRNGPDLDRVRRLEADPTIRSKAETVIGYVGEISPQDGVDHLIRALAHLVYDLERPDVFAVVVGTGDQLDSLRALTRKLELQDHVEFSGRQEGDALMRKLSAADIFVDPDPSNPYNDRCSMIKMSEYMALGRPIVAFDLPEHRVTAGDSALYAKANDPMDLARLIAELIEDPERRLAMGTSGRRQVEERLAWHHQAPLLVSAYEAAFGPSYRRGDGRVGSAGCHDLDSSAASEIDS